MIDGGAEPVTHRRLGAQPEESGSIELREAGPEAGFQWAGRWVRLSVGKGFAADLMPSAWSSN